MYSIMKSNIFKAYKSFVDLPLLHKIFIIVLIIVFTYLVNPRPLIYENYEDMTSGKRFESKIDSEVFDLFYSKYYDDIHENKDRDVAQLKIILNGYQYLIWMNFYILQIKLI